MAEIDAQTKKQAEKSEAFKGIGELWVNYKKFCFEVISKLPNDQVKQWVAFSDGRIEDALKKKRTIGKNISDYYFIGLLFMIATIIGFWPIFAYLGFIGTILAAFGPIAIHSTNAWFMALLILAIITVAGLVLPVVSLLVISLGYLLAAKLLGGRGNYADTMSVIVFTSSAKLTLMIPMYALYAVLVGYVLSPLMWVIAVYEIYLTYKGLRSVHGISRNRAVGTLILGAIFSAAILSVIVIGIVFLAFALLSQNFRL